MDSERICKNCRYWKFKAIKVLGGERNSFGRCKKLSIAGFEALTAWDSTCEGDEDINSFERRIKR